MKNTNQKQLATQKNKTKLNNKNNSMIKMSKNLKKCD